MDFLQAGNGLEGSPGACPMSLWVFSLQMDKGREVVMTLAKSSIQADLGRGWWWVVGSGWVGGVGGRGWGSSFMGVG